jgi:hypothetical protein
MIIDGLNLKRLTLCLSTSIDMLSTEEVTHRTSIRFFELVPYINNSSDCEHVKKRVPLRWAKGSTVLRDINNLGADSELSRISRTLANNLKVVSEGMPIISHNVSLRFGRWLTTLLILGSGPMGF